MMSTSPSVSSRKTSLHEGREGLDVDWLLHSKRDFPSHLKTNSRPRQDAQSGQPLSSKADNTAASTANNASSPAHSHAPTASSLLDTSKSGQVNGTTNKSLVSPASAAHRTDNQRKETAEESKHVGGRNAFKREGRRSSWITSLGHKLSGGGGSKPTKSDGQQTRSASQSPAFESGNPFDKHASDAATPQDDEPSIPVPSSPRRPSVLVAAGTETKVDHPGFLTSALRRLSSGTSATLGKGAGTGALCPRKILNVDFNRDRVKIADFEPNKLRRVAFCVDVEIAGVASHADETHTHVEPAGDLPKSHSGLPADRVDGKKDAKVAKYKEKGEADALKNPQDASYEKENLGQTKVDAVSEAKEDQRESLEEVEDKHEKIEAKEDEPVVPTITRKKEKKKRSEAERKERKERKRKHAVANGLVPLELTRDVDDSDTTTDTNSPGSNTPRKIVDQPTTDPLRIYKRCCQLRETTAQAILKDQITKPTATLAEAPGTVAMIDLSGNQLSLQDIVTFGDWLAVVPVRKLILDDCELSDEAVRVILSGLLSCKTSSQARHNRKLPKPYTGKHGQEQMGFIEKLSLKNNAAITNIGWKHIALFMHMSRSLRAIDLTGIPYPQAQTNDTLSRTSTANSAATSNGVNGATSRQIDMATLVARAIAERMGTALEELILSGCNLSASNLADIVNAAIRCKIRRLGLAANNLNDESLQHIVRYVQSGVCEGLDLGSNDLHDTGQFLTDAIDENNPLFALSIADCNLEPDDLNQILPRLATLQNFKFVDLSRNRGLFNGSKTAVSLFRKWLPKMPELKRIHLADVDLQPDHIIALAEMLPDCPSLCHVNILENSDLIKAMNSKSGEHQEEAAAFLASLMTAVRVSQTIIAIEFEVPSSESSEVVKALASQVLAYSLRNMERSALSDMGVAPPSHMPDKDAPEVLLHLVGHMDGYTENHDKDEPAPDEDYIIASTGIVKALGVCLRNQDGSRAVSRNISPSASGTVTPRHGSQLRPTQQKKPRDVGRELCESARKIRMRLRPALVKEDRLGNTENYRRLAALDGTLERLIQRFEDEYPDAKVDLLSSQASAGSPPESPDISRVNSVSDPRVRQQDHNFSDGDESWALKLSRTPSNTSLAARALTHEEGRMHRFGQSIRRELLKRPAADAENDDMNKFVEPSEQTIASLKRKIEHIKGEDIRRQVEEFGPDAVIRDIGLNAEELRAYRLADPEGFEKFRESQLAAAANIDLSMPRRTSFNDGSEKH